MKRRIRSACLVPLHFNTTLDQRAAVEKFADDKGLSLGAALREIVAAGLGRGAE